VRSDGIEDLPGQEGLADPGAPSTTTLTPAGVRRSTTPSTRSRMVRATVARSGGGGRLLATLVIGRA
jgi:hypothetical protein